MEGVTCSQTLNLQNYELNKPLLYKVPSLRYFAIAMEDKLTQRLFVISPYHNITTAIPINTTTPQQWNLGQGIPAQVPICHNIIYVTLSLHGILKFILFLRILILTLISS
jgi:hypothetical protein